jgi:hypothetical protein
MKREWKLFVGLCASSLTLASGISIFGQQKQSPPDQTVVIQRERVIQGPEGPPPDHNFMFVSSEMNFNGKLVKGAPYSAQAVTETTQTLPDGNRIVNKSTAAVYRDSEGRTRREQTLRAIGPFATAGEAPQTIFISDPVAGVNYALDPRTHVARKMAPMKFEFKFGPHSAGEKAFAGPPQAPPPPPPAERPEMQSQVFFHTAAPSGGEGGRVMEWHSGREKTSKTESLGKQTIEGVEAEGTRTTTTIAAGEIGNERPIEIVFERWYSPELQVAVMTRHADPRFGETSYRLTNIDRGEPVHSLFEVPADYTVKEAPTLPPGQKIRMKKPAGGQ